MCGISAILNPEESQITNDRLERLYHYIDSRGPDHRSETEQIVTKCGLILQVKASVLHLRGKNIQQQPIVDDNKNVLMFNGQIYRLLGRQQQISDGLADTTYLFNRLNSCTDSTDVVNILRTIDGPFAFIYWSVSLSTLFYGRDIFGRKSLCVLMKNGHALYPTVISSVALPDIVDVNLSHDCDKHQWLEVDCKKIHSINFSNPNEVKCRNFFWNLDKIYPRTKKCSATDEDSTLTDVNRIEIDFLGSLNNDLRSSSEFNLEEKEVAIEILERHLLKAVEIRVRYNRDTCLSCRRIRYEDSSFDPLCNHAKVGVAFSGGIDSTVLAMALDKIVNSSETIDLVTVAFKNNSPDRESVSKAFLELRRLCPKRPWQLVLCDVSKEELELERRKWIANLIAPCTTVLDDSLGCACYFIGRARGRALSSQVDDNWMTDNYEQFLQFDPSNRIASINSSQFTVSSYTSPATMFFVGSSIDEQLGGYSSHRSEWKDRGNWGVFDEVSYLMRRLSTRNLGRDDRVYSHHGRDLKLPYLDFEFVSYLNRLPIGLKMNLNKPLDEGPKWLLRELAIKWNLIETARRVKRALQFGTKIANLENSKEKGDDVCKRLVSSSAQYHGNDPFLHN